MISQSQYLSNIKEYNQIIEQIENNISADLKNIKNIEEFNKSMFAKYNQDKQKYKYLEEYILEANIGLAFWVGNKYIKSIYDIPNYVSLLMEVLLKAIRKFNPEFDNEFSSYAVSALQNASLFCIKIENQKCNKIYKEWYNYEEPSCLDIKYDVETPTPITKKIEGSPELNYIHKEGKNTINNLIENRLSEKEKIVIKALTGIDCPKVSQTYLANQLGVTPQYISLLYTTAIKKLKKTIKFQNIEQNLAEYLTEEDILRNDDSLAN